jgi:hypothetical protein
LAVAPLSCCAHSVSLDALSQHNKQFDAMNDAVRLAEVVKAAGFEATPII